MFKKLGKSLVAFVDIQTGDTITLDMLSGKIFGSPIIPVRESNEVINKLAKRSIAKGEPIQYADLSL